MEKKRNASRWCTKYFVLAAIGLCCLWCASPDHALAGDKSQKPLGSLRSGVEVEDSGLSRKDIVASDVLAAQRGGGNWITIATIPGVPAAKAPSITLWDELRPPPAQSAPASVGQSVNQRTVQIR